MYQSSITQEGYILIGKEETKTNEQIMSESLTKYDLTHTMAPFLDTHLFFDIFSHFENNNTNCYLKEDLLNAKLELVKQTNMVDMEMELFQYACMAYLKEELDEDTYDKVRACLGLQPLNQAVKAGMKQSEKILNKFN